MSEQRQEARSAATPSGLREFADALDKDRGHDKSMVTRLMRDAADEIERLRETLEQIASGQVEQRGSLRPSFADAANLARKALDGDRNRP